MASGAATFPVFASKGGGVAAIAIDRIWLGMGGLGQGDLGGCGLRAFALSTRADPYSFDGVTLGRSLVYSKVGGGDADGRRRAHLVGVDISAGTSTNWVAGWDSRAAYGAMSRGTELCLSSPTRSALAGSAMVFSYASSMRFVLRGICGTIQRLPDILKK